MQLEDFIPYVVTFFLLLLRCSAMFFLTPTFGSQGLPKRIRVTLAAGTAIVLTPLAGPMPFEGLVPVVLAGAGELVLGLSMGLVIALVLMAAGLAGEIAGMQMGFAFNRVVDPVSGQNLAVTARVLTLLATMVFLSMDGHHMILSGLGYSLKHAPLGSVLPNSLYIETLIPLLGICVSTALRISAPVMVALLLTNVSIGLLARAAPQLNLFVFAFGVSIGLGTVMFTLSMRSSLSLLAREFTRIPLYISALLGG